MCIYHGITRWLSISWKDSSIWDKLSLGEHSPNTKPWLLSPFDQIEFYPVTEEEVDAFSEQMNAGKFKVDIVESVFDHGKYLEWIQENSKSIEEFNKTKEVRN